MNQEAIEAKLVQKTVSMLRVARHVIEKLHDDKEKAFQEEPSLSDLVLVAQIIGQTSMVDRLGEAGLPEGAELPSQAVSPAVSGQLVLPDIYAIWGQDGWYVNGHPGFQLQPQHCRTKEELSAVLQGLVDVCASNRIS